MEFAPDAPIDLQNDLAVTSDTTVGISWRNGASDGGASVIDYRISYDQSVGNYVTLAEGLTDSHYSTTSSVSLIKGQTYRFKVQARNSVGLSLHSVELPVLVAKTPDKPAAPSTIIDGNYVKITWLTPYDGSTPITGYHVTIRHSDDATFSEESTNCKGTELAIV